MSIHEQIFSIAEEQELIPLINSEKVMLFLGVGFSVDAKNISRNNIPTASQLSQLMNNILTSYGQVGFSANNVFNLKLVADAFYRFHKDNPSYIDLFFKTHLTVDRSQIPKEYFYLKYVSWNGIYTTNYDDLLEAIFESEEIGMIKINKATYKRYSSDLPVDNGYNLIYLNGDLNSNARIEKNNGPIVTDIICSTNDHASNSIPPIWDYFFDKFRQYPIIVVGSQLNEDFFYSKIGEILNNTNIDISKRPKSYIINLDNDDQKFVEFKSKYNLHHKYASTNQFLQWLCNNKLITNPKLLPTTINLSNSPDTSSHYTILDNGYWENLKGVKSKDELIKYYTNINSSAFVLPFVIAEDFYIPPHNELNIKSISSSIDSINISLDKILPKDSRNNNTLIKINANGGAGKTTLLYHIGKFYSNEYHVILFHEIPSNNIALPNFEKDSKPILILIDNYKNYIDNLKYFSDQLNKIFYNRGYCLIITERYIHESTIESKYVKEVEELFCDVIECSIIHKQSFYLSIFELIIASLNLKSSLQSKIYDKLKIAFIKETKATIAERIIELMLAIKTEHLGFKFNFDWEDWEEYCKSKTILQPYINLYSIVAAFNNYQITPPISFCIKLLGINDPSLIQTYSIFSKPNYDFPIAIHKDNYFELRNPNLAEWFLHERDSAHTLTLRYFKLGLSEYNNPDSLYLLRNTYRNKLVQQDKTLNGNIPKYADLLNIFEAYIKSFPLDSANVKNKMEMVIINLITNQKENAKAILKEMIQSHPDELHARTKLTDILIKEKHFEEAKPLVDYLALKDPTDINIIKFRIDIQTNSREAIKTIKEIIDTISPDNIPTLKYLYAKLAKYHRIVGDLLEAEKYCNLLLSWNNFDFSAMNTLSMIFQKQGKLFEAENILLKSIQIKEYNPHNYNELGQVYLQLFSQTGLLSYKFKALQIFIKGLKLSPCNIPLRTEFARFLMTECKRFKLPEQLLLKNIELDDKHFHSYTELGKLYQKRNLFLKSKNILEKGLMQIDLNHLKNEHIPLLVMLGNAYLETKDLINAENAFNKTLSIKSNNWASHIGIAKSYLLQRKDLDYDKVYNKILEEYEESFGLCDFASWLKNNSKIDDALKIIEKSKALQSNNINTHICTLLAEITLNKLMSLKRIDTLEAFKLIGQCETNCKSSLLINSNNEYSLHILYRLNLLLFEHKKQSNSYLQKSYESNYKKYLGKLFLTNRNNSYGLEGIAHHLKSVNKNRLAIAVIERYGNISENAYLYISQLSYFYGKLNNKLKVSELKEMAIQNKISTNKILFDNSLVLISQNSIGLIVGNKIISKDIKYEMAPEGLMINKNAYILQSNNKEELRVYFALYQFKQNLIANFIEPYFDELPNNDSIIEILELK